MDHQLPSWACDICGVPHSARIADLPTQISSGSAGDRKALAHYFTTMLTRRLTEAALKATRCLPHSKFILDVDVVHQMEISKRTSNCLRRYVQDKPEGVQLDELTFGDLASIPNMGAKSIIELLIYMEHFAPSENEDSPEAEQSDPLASNERKAFIDLLLTAQEATWKDEVVCGDRRFPEIARPIGKVHLSKGETFGAFVDLLADQAPNLPIRLLSAAQDAVESVIDKVGSLADLPLDEVLRDFIRAHYRNAKPQNLEAMYARFGLVREGRRTLEESGRIAGITRERVRQIENKILNALPIGEQKSFMPGLEDAVLLANESVGLSALDFSDELKKQGITKSHVSADAIFLFAELCGIDSLSVSVKRLRSGMRAIASDAFNLNRIDVICRRLCSRNGVADIDLAARHFDVDKKSFSEPAKQYLSHAKAWIALDSDQRWWTLTERELTPRNRLINVARKILSVSNPVSADDLRDGFLKLARFRNSSSNSYTGANAIVVPSRQAILGFFNYLSDYDVAGDQISTDAQLDFRDELGEVEQSIVDVLRTSPNGVLTRYDIIRASTKRGVNENSLMLYTTYSPVVQRFAQETFKLVGKEIAASALSAHQLAVSQKIKTKRILIADWKDGKIRLCMRVPEHTSSMVIGIPSTVRDFLKSRSFDAYDEDDNPVGTLSSNDDGSMWGFGKFCQLRGIEEDDILAIEFELGTGRALIYQCLLSEILDDID